MKQLQNVYTSQYNYRGKDRIDITVKGQNPDWKAFAPTWAMVMGFKKGEITESQYITKYNDILSNVKENVWDELLSLGQITLVCFCKRESFCHRDLLAIYLSKRGINYKGFKVLEEDTSTFISASIHTLSLYERYLTVA